MSTGPLPVWRRSFHHPASNDAPSVVAELPRRPSVSIGSRWQPTHALVRDPDSGVFFERNPRMDSAAELDVQRALLTQRRNNHGRYWFLALLLPVAAWAFCKVMY